MSGSQPPSQAIPEEWLTAYLDDELKAEQRQQVEEAVSQDSKLAQLLEDLRATRQLVSHLPQFASVARRTAAEVGASVDELEDGIVESPKRPTSTARTFDHQLDRPGFPWRWLAMAAGILGIASVGGLLWMRPATMWSSLGLNDAAPASSVEARASQTLDLETSGNVAADSPNDLVGSSLDGGGELSAPQPAMEPMLADSLAQVPAIAEANRTEAAAALPSPTMSALSAAPESTAGAVSGQVDSFTAPLAAGGGAGGMKSLPDSAVTPLPKDFAPDAQPLTAPENELANREIGSSASNGLSNKVMDTEAAADASAGLDSAPPIAMVDPTSSTALDAELLPAPASRQSLSPPGADPKAQVSPSNAVGGQARSLSKNDRDAKLGARGRGAQPRASWHQSNAWNQQEVEAQINSNGLFRPIKRLLPAEQQMQLSQQVVVNENISTAVLRVTPQQLEQLAQTAAALGILPAVEVTEAESSQALFVSKTELTQLLSGVVDEKKIFWVQSTAASDTDRRCVLIINSGL